MPLQASKPTARAATPGGIASFQQFKGGPARRRLIVMAEASEKCGKTHFALTAPAPIYYQNLNFGDEGVIEKFADKEIYKASYRVVLPTEAASTNLEAVAVAAESVYSQWRMDYYSAIRKGRSVVIDDGSEHWELTRLSHFGTLEKVLARNYGPPNRDMREMMSEALTSDSNLIIPVKLTDEYLNDKRTGSSKPKCWGDLPYDVQVVVRCRKEPGPEFVMDIVSCRQNPQIEGITIPNDFLTLAMLVFPDSKTEDWQ